MNEHKTTLLGRRIGYNERKQKDARKQKFVSAVHAVCHWVKRGGWIALAAVVVLGIALWDNRFYLQRFNPLELRHLQYVEIEGNRMLSWEDVMQGSQIETGMLMSEVNADSVADLLLQMPIIRSVSVEKKFPSSLYIKLTESSPVLSVLDAGKATIYSEKGEILPFSMATAMRLPVLDNASLNQVKMIADFLMTMKTEDEALYAKVSQVAWSEKDKGIEVYFKDVGFRTLFSESDWNESVFALYESVENGFAKDLKCAGEVDLRFNGFAYVRNYDKRCGNG